MNNKSYQIQLPRLSQDEQTFAILDYDLDARGIRNLMDDEGEFMFIMVKGVTQWVRDTEDGQACFKYAGNDLNIGDLCSHGGEAWIKSFFNGYGVYNLRISIFCQENKKSSEWHYDSVLVNEGEIKA